MKRQSSYGKLDATLVFLLVLILAACGSSNQEAPQPQANQASSQTTMVAPDPSGAAKQPTQLPGTPAPTLDGNSELPLADIIVGSWVSTMSGSGTVLDFTADGRFVKNSDVTSLIRYELVDNHSIDLIDGTGKKSVAIGEISEDTMVISQSPWASQPETFQKLGGARNLREDILGFWFAEGFVGQEIDVNSGVVFPMMYFSPEGRFIGSVGDGSTYETWSNGLAVVSIPDWGLVKPLRFRYVSPSEVEVLFLSENDELEPPYLPKPRSVVFTKLDVNDGMTEQLVGRWNSVDGFEGEFTQDGMFEGDIVGNYRVYGDGILLLDTGTSGVVRKIRFISDDQLEINQLDVEEDGVLVVVEGESSVLTRVR